MQMRFGKNTVVCYNDLESFFFSRRYEFVNGRKEMLVLYFREVALHLSCCSNFDPDSQRRRRRRTSSTGKQKLFLIVKCCFPRPFTFFSLSSLNCSAQIRLFSSLKIRETALKGNSK